MWDLYETYNKLTNINLDIIIYKLKNIWNICGIPFLIYNFIKCDDKLFFIGSISILIFYYDNLTEIYNDKLYYTEKILDWVILMKLIYFNKTNTIKSNFILNKVELYINLNSKTDVTHFFKKNNIKQIDTNIIKQIFNVEQIVFNNNEDIRLKLYFDFLNKSYIIYFPYKRLINDENIDDYHIPYPPFTNEIMDDYRNDIILPYHNVKLKKKMFYSLFHIDSKDILTVEINKKTNDNLIDYFNKIKTPFLDYGLLYNVPIKLKWILIENNIDLNDFKEFYFKFLNLYLCEDEFDLKEHHLLMDIEDLDNIFITERMQKILDEKKKNQSDVTQIIE